MKNFWLMLLLFTPLCAETIFEPAFSIGNSNKELSWTIKDSAGKSSTLEWRDLISIRKNLSITISHAKLQASFEISQDETTQGTVTDSDYDPNLYKQSIADAKGSTFSDELLTIGTQLGELRTIQLVLLGAYYQSNSKFVLKNGKEIVPITKPINNLDSSYKIRTKGFGGIVQLNYSPYAQYGSISLGYGTFILDYKANGNWNSRPDIKEFEHIGTANREIYFGQLDIKIPKNLTIFMRIDQASYRLSGGRDLLIKSDGSTISSNLDNVSFDEQTIKIGIKGRF